MKRNIIKKLILLSMIAGILFTACEDEFSKNNGNDVLQKIDVSIYVYDVLSDSSITNAEVTMFLESGEETEITNELGIAYFTDVKISSNVLVSVEKEEYLKRDAAINIYTNDQDLSQFNTNIALYSPLNTATIKGRLEIETDLTNDETEFVAEGTIIYAQLNDIYGSSIEYAAVVGANGEYEFIVPVDNYGVSYNLRFPAFEQNQTVAINGIYGDPYFPEAFPTIETINTTFSPEGYDRSIPFVSPVYAYIDPSANFDKIAVINNVVVDSIGEISGIEFHRNGSGYTADSVDVNIVSLFEGSGAVIRIGVQDSSIYSCNAVYHNRGSNYPTFSNANQVAPHSNLTDVYNLKSGEIQIVNLDYGTGKNRDQEIR